MIPSHSQTHPLPFFQPNPAGTALILTLSGRSTPNSRVHVIEKQGTGSSLGRPDGHFTSYPLCKGRVRGGGVFGGWGCRWRTAGVVCTSWTGTKTPSHRKPLLSKSSLTGRLRAWVGMILLVGPLTLGLRRPQGSQRRIRL